MGIHYSTASLAGPLDQAAAFETLLAGDLTPIELGERTGLVSKPHPAVRSAHLAFLPEGPALPNLGADDDDLRRQAVRAAKEALARCEWLGIPYYGVSPGWALVHSVLRGGAAIGPAAPRPRSLAQLERSLYDLASAAHDRHLELGVSNTGARHGGLLASPEEIRRVFATVGAPNLRLTLDLGCLATDAAAAAALAALAGLVRMPARDGIDRLRGDRGPELASALAAVPWVLDARDRTPGDLRMLACRLEEALHALA